MNTDTAMQSRGGCWFAVAPVLYSGSDSFRAGEEKSGVNAGFEGSW
jgi:hypothetical protein